MWTIWGYQMYFFFRHSYFSNSWSHRYLFEVCRFIPTEARYSPSDSIILFIYFVSHINSNCHNILYAIFECCTALSEHKRPIVNELEFIYFSWLIEWLNKITQFECVCVCVYSCVFLFAYAFAHRIWVFGSVCVCRSVCLYVLVSECVSDDLRKLYMREKHNNNRSIPVCLRVQN